MLRPFKWAFVGLGLCLLALLIWRISVDRSATRAIETERVAWTERWATAGEAPLSALQPDERWEAAVQAYEALPTSALLAIDLLADAPPEELAAAIADAQNALQRLRVALAEAAADAAIGAHPDDPYLERLLSTMNWTRQFARLLIAEALVAIAQGDFDAAGGSLVNALRLSRIVGAHGPLIATLTAVAVDAIVIETIQSAFADGGGARAELLRELAERNYEQALARAMRGEAAFAFHSLLDAESGWLSTDPEGSPTPWMKQDAAYLLMFQRRVHDALIEGTPLRDLPSVLRDMPSPSRFARMSANVAPAVAGTASGLLQIDVRRTMAVTALMLRSRQQADGSYPASLASLADAPVDPATGQPLHYESDGGGVTLRTEAEMHEDYAEWRWSR